VAGDLAAHERERGADRGQDLGMLGAHVRATQAPRDLRGQRGPGKKKKHDRDLGAEVVGARGVGDRLGDLVHRAVEQGASGLLGRAPHAPPERGEALKRRGACALRGRGGPVRRRARGGDGAVSRLGDVDDAERVRRARGGERVAPPVGRREDRVLRRVPWPGRDELDLGAGELLRIGETGVRQAGDMRAARAGLLDLAPPETAEGPAGRPDHPRVDGADRRRAAHDAQRAQDRAPALDDAHVGARAAALQDDPVREGELVQCRGDARGRP
jgi:hypothetical protein